MTCLRAMIVATCLVAPSVVGCSTPDQRGPDTVEVRPERTASESTPAAESAAPPTAGEPLVITSHCGVRSATVDGLLWLATPPLGDHNPPPGWDDNETSGRFVRTSRTTGVFTTDTGLTARFTRAPRGAKDPNLGCE